MRGVSNLQNKNFAFETLELNTLEIKGLKKLMKKHVFNNKNKYCF